MNVGLGDTVSICLPGDSDTISLTINALADTNIGQGLFMSKEAWEACRKGDFQVTTLLITAPTPACSHLLEEMDEVGTLLYPAKQLVEMSSIMDSTTAAFTILSVAALALAWVYPFMKRYTHLPQVVLGAAFGWSIPMAFAAVSESLPLSCWLMFLANILWAVAYDTQYAMVDRDDDLKIGIKSTAILFGRQDKLIIGILQVAVLALMVAIGRLNGLNWAFYWSVLVAGLLFAYQQKLIAKREREACFKAFLNNNYVGLVLFLGLAMSYWS